MNEKHRRSARFQELVARQPDNAMFRFSLGQALLEEGNAAEAVPHLVYCAQARSDWMMARILLGRARLVAGQREAARQVWAEALQLAVEQNHETPEAELRALLADLEAGR